MSVDPVARDHHWMRRALVLARRRAGATWPNPTVGCCIVRDGKLLAEAIHEGPGALHAEAAALAQIDDASGATAYVTLEPCHHEGRTPPCSRALAGAGIARVVYAVSDDTPRHPGGGARWLQEQGVRVEAGVLGELARELNHPFFETTTDGEAHVTLKLALSLDGGLARRAGRIHAASQRAITGQRTRRRVHRMRAGANAVLVGAGTVRADHPRLDVRDIPVRSWSGVTPRAVVLCGGTVLEPETLPANALLLGSAGAGRIEVPERAGGRLDWAAVTSGLVARGMGILLVEGGARIAADLLAESPPQRIHLYLAGRGLGPGAVRLPGGIRLDDRYATLRVRRVGPDVEWVLRRRDLG